MWIELPWSCLHCIARAFRVQLYGFRLQTPALLLPPTADTCRQGVPFSYATGEEYGVNDNSFLLTNYNDWSIGVMEDEGSFSDHTSGLSSTDGRW